MTELQKRWQSLQSEREGLVSSSLSSSAEASLEHHDKVSSGVALKEQTNPVNVSDIETPRPLERYLRGSPKRLATYKKISDTMDTIVVSGLMIEIGLIVLILPVVIGESWLSSWEMLQAVLIYNGLIIAMIITGYRSLKTVEKVEHHLKFNQKRLYAGNIN